MALQAGGIEESESITDPSILEAAAGLQEEGFPEESTEDVSNRVVHPELISQLSQVLQTRPSDL